MKRDRAFVVFPTDTNSHQVEKLQFSVTLALGVHPCSMLVSGRRGGEKDVPPLLWGIRVTRKVSMEGGAWREGRPVCWASVQGDGGMGGIKNGHAAKDTKEFKQVWQWFHAHFPCSNFQS